MWFKMGGERVEEVVAEAPSVPAVDGQPAIQDSGLGGGFPPRPAETPAADMARDLQNNQRDAAITEAAKTLPNLAPAPIEPADRSSVDALNAELQKIQGEQAARENPAVSIDVNPGPGFGQNIIDATRKPWSGGRRPRNAVIDAPTTDTSGAVAAADELLVDAAQDKTEEVVVADPAQEAASNGEVEDVTALTGTENTDGVGAMQVGPIGLAANTEGGNAEGNMGGEVAVGGDSSAAAQGEAAGAAIASEVASQITGVDTGETAVANNGTQVDAPPVGEPTVESAASDSPDSAVVSNSTSNGIDQNGVVAGEETPTDSQVDQPGMNGSAGTEDETDTTAATQPQAVVDEVVPATDPAPTDEIVPASPAEPVATPEPIVDEVVNSSDAPVAPDEVSTDTTAPSTPETTVQDSIPEATGDASVVIDGTENNGIDDPVAEEPSDAVEDPAVATVDSVEESTSEAREDSDFKIMGRGEDGSENSDQATPTAEVSSDLQQKNQELQEKADQIVDMPIREGIAEIGKIDLKDRAAVLNRVAREVVLRQMEKDGIVKISDIPDGGDFWKKVSGMRALYELWVKEDRGYIASDEKIAEPINSEVVTDQNPPADDTQAA